MSTPKSTTRSPSARPKTIGLSNILGWYMWTAVVSVIILASAAAIGWLWGIDSVPSVSANELVAIKCLGAFISVANMGFWIRHIQNFWGTERP